MTRDGGIEVQFDSYAGRVGEEALPFPQRRYLLHFKTYPAIVEASDGFGKICTLGRDVAEPTGVIGRRFLPMEGGQLQQRMACGIQPAAGGAEWRSLADGQAQGPGIELGQRVEFIQGHADVVVIHMRHRHAAIRLSIDADENTRRGLRC
jgi:hypothetical protein